MEPIKETLQLKRDFKVTPVTCYHSAKFGLDLSVTNLMWMLHDLMWIMLSPVLAAELER